MGSHQTWHGIPDGRTDWVSLQIVSRDTEARTDSDSELSAGGKTMLEAKNEFTVGDIDQITAQAVVSSFTHHFRHREQNPLIPAIGIAAIEGSLVIVMYDCEQDVLLTSDHVQWLDMDERQLSREGVVLLWLTIHHRLFLKNLAEFENQLQAAGLHRIFREAGALHEYQTLDYYYTKDWPPRKWLKRQPSGVPELSLKAKRPRV